MVGFGEVVEVGVVGVLFECVVLVGVEFGFCVGLVVEDGF